MENDDEADKLRLLTQTVDVQFDRVNEKIVWKDLFPEWINEDETFKTSSCPEIPLSIVNLTGLDVVIARVPCGGGGGSDVEDGAEVKDVFRLQLNLIVADLMVRNGWQDQKQRRKDVYAVFVGSCGGGGGAMWEIFRCEDLLWHEGDVWVYKPDLWRLKEKLTMPVGSCQLAPPYNSKTSERFIFYSLFKEKTRRLESSGHRRREAYVTVLHSSESYVCGAIALAHSIRRSNSTKDLVLLADDSISPVSLLGLRRVGWKIKRIQRIKSPHAEKGAYNEWNYSKLRIWELIHYDKIIFIDSDFLVLENLDSFFDYPELSAVGNSRDIFNSGVMLVEPSICKFKKLMEIKDLVGSYNGGDQGFLNQIIVWWHRWPTRLNFLKAFPLEMGDEIHEKLPLRVSALHYLGWKPWMCYRDYDCNWDMEGRRMFASDEAHRRWWEVYRTMPSVLQSYCGLDKETDDRLKKWRERAKVNTNFSDGHWKIQIKDPRRKKMILSSSDR
ncbi:putative UDP-glucuronate:xylan alpha-glucuronosyltransferase 5 [Impatiens glandulifera]|uniref:putative UDP-glucuronate:xylan alpha-glucuronosyltransferase 5 n=1 Tax=Impatiens glandulifera TaxID=253017 RepID=UPI001FB0B795|nr:putative UDP-glucuronate:xylan alpha-glucuronosyltransferase 5 [Impatiens glandulifera]